MNNIDTKKIVEKIMETTYVEFIDQIAYLLRYSKNGGVHIIHNEIEKYVIDYIKNKNVSDLTDNQKLILMIEWVYEAIGDDRYKETPFSIIENLTDAELRNEINRRLKLPNSNLYIESNIGIL